MQNRFLGLLLMSTVLIVIAFLGVGTPLIKTSVIEGTTTELPHEPYPFTNLPIESNFNEGKMEPFKLLAAFVYRGYGEASFEYSYLKYVSSSWSWVITRTELQDTVNVKYVWKAVDGNLFIIEAWNAYSNKTGRTAMIAFKDGKVYQIRYQNGVYLMDFNPFRDFVTVQMSIDYNVPEIRDLWINEYHFTHLSIKNEPIGPTSPFWQMQVFLQESGVVLIKEMKAWK
jgi:hypothetical protein